jgi:hypothetical protein
MVPIPTLSPKVGPHLFGVALLLDVSRVIMLRINPLLPMQQLS